MSAESEGGAVVIACYPPPSTFNTFNIQLCFHKTKRMELSGLKHAFLSDNSFHLPYSSHIHKAKLTKNDPLGGECELKK